MINRFEGKYWFLSNFYAHPIVLDDISYPTNEHYFQSMKTLVVEEALAIAIAITPREAKYLGRSCTLRPDWDEVKNQIMREAIAAKFPIEQTPLSGLLVHTHPHELVEGNNWGDRYWGKVNGKGENWLGWLLESRREDLIDAGIQGIESDVPNGKDWYE